MLAKLKKINYKNFLPYGIGLLILAVVFVVFPHQVKAQNAITNGLGSLVVSLLSWIFQAFIYVTGTLLIKAIEILIKVLAYNDFLNSPIVVKGWTVLRDTCNIGITIIMLLMSFYAVFKKESYQYQKFLPKLIAAAILINFSKVITGFVIDVSQVFMMTFVNAFKDAAAGNLTYGFGIEDMLKFREAAGGGIFDSNVVDLSGSINNWSIFGGLVLASLMILIALVIVISLVVMMTYRILMLWFLIMASPIAFIGGLLPGKQEDDWHDQWWKELNKYLVKGPVVAFMLWLSFAVISEMTESKHIMYLQFESQITAGNVSATDGWSAFANKISGTQNIMDYLVTCGLLILTLVMASKTGIAGSKIAGNFMNKLEGAGKWIQKRPEAWGRAGVKRFGTSYLAQGAVALAGRVKESRVVKTVGFNKDYNAEKAATRAAQMQEMIGGRVGAVRSMEKKLASEQGERLKKMGMGNWTDEELSKQYTDTIRGLKVKIGKFGGTIHADDKATAQAMLQEMANRKGLTEEAMADYQKTFGYKKGGDEKNALKTDVGKNAAVFESETWDLQKKAGDNFAAFKKKSKYNVKNGEYEPYSADDDIEANAKREIKEIGSDINDKTFSGKVDENGQPVNPFEVKWMKKFIEHHEGDIGRLDVAKKKILRQSIENMLAFQGEHNLDADTVSKFKKFHQYLNAKSAKAFDRNGELEDPTLLGDEITDDKLTKIRLKLQGKNIGGMRTVAEAAKERLNDVDAALSREFYHRDQTMDETMGGLVASINGLKEAIRSGNDTATIKNNLQQALQPLLSRFKDTPTGQVDPKTGQNFTDRELFEKGRLSRAVKFVNDTLGGAGAALQPEEKKALDQSLSYIAAHVQGLSEEGKKTQEVLSDLRSDTRFLAGNIDGAIEALGKETDGAKRKEAAIKMFRSAKKMLSINQSNPDQNYLANIKRLKTQIGFGVRNQSLFNEGNLKDLKNLNSEIGKYYS